MESRDSSAVGPCCVVVGIRLLSLHDLGAGTLVNRLGQRCNHRRALKLESSGKVGILILANGFLVWLCIDSHLFSPSGLGSVICGS